MNNLQPLQQPPKLKVDLSQLKTHKCVKCENTSFIAGMEVRVLPMLLSPTGKLEIVNVPIAVCSICGARVLESDLALTGQSKVSEGQA
jgi:predicted nucleic-acid-binding Zn-ribbon protein